MSSLVDTQYLIWSLFEPEKIRKPALRILSDPDMVKYVSKISFWEIALKYSIGKLRLKGTDPEGVLLASLDAGFKVFDINEGDIASSFMLPFLKKHRDPFDRLIVWQCIRNDMPLLSADGAIREYVRYGLRLAI